VADEVVTLEVSASDKLLSSAVGSTWLSTFSLAPLDDDVCNGAVAKLLSLVTEAGAFELP
jgi:hypothetical protein